MRTLYLLAGLAVTMMASIGCSGGGGLPVTGKVTLDGQPVDGASLVFVSDSGAIYGATTNAQGEYSAGGQEGKGLPEGNYQVSVSKAEGTAGQSAAMDPMKMKEKMQEASKKGVNVAKTGGAAKSVIPAKYSTAKTSGLSAKVASGQTTHNFELKSDSGAKTDTK